MYNNIESDEVLIERIKGGDCDAFNPLVERYKLPLYKVMYRIVMNRDDAEDLVEEAFIRAYRSMSKFESGKPFYSWLRKIAVNNAINFLRKEHKARTESLEAHQVILRDSKHDPVDMTRQKLLQERIKKAMSKLSDEYRTILILRVEEELSYEEIGSMLKIPRGTVMSRLARARQRLKELFKETEVDKYEM